MNKAKCVAILLIHNKLCSSVLHVRNIAGKVLGSGACTETLKLARKEKDIITWIKSAFTRIHEEENAECGDCEPCSKSDKCI